MHILIVDTCKIPVHKYGGTERVIWYLGKELTRVGHKVTYLVEEGSSCEFADVRFLDKSMPIASQTAGPWDIVHLNSQPDGIIQVPYVVTMHGNLNEQVPLDKNTIFISRNHAERFGSDEFVYNGMDWDDYSKPDLSIPRRYYHFLGKAAWRIKNVKGAVQTIDLTRNEKLYVLGGTRLNVNMGFRFTTSMRTRFFGMVGGEEKNKLLNGSKGLVFPVRWHEPFGLALTESLYYGCPIFGTPYGSLPEITGDRFGFLSANAKELAHAIDEADFSPKECHEYAAETFNSRLMALSYLRMYERVLNGKTIHTQNPMLKEVQTEKFLPWK